MPQISLSFVSQEQNTPNAEKIGPDSNEPQRRIFLKGGNLD